MNIKSGLLFGLLSLVCVCSAYSMSGRSGVDLPKPDESISAKITDKQGFIITANNVSVEGNTYFSLKRGNGTYFVNFNDIDHINFESASDSKIDAKVFLRSGEKLNAVVDKLTILYGETSFGKFKIDIEGINKISFTKTKQSPSKLSETR